MRICVLHSGDSASASMIIDALQTMSHDAQSVLFDAANPPEGFDVILNICDNKLESPRVPRALRMKNVTYAGNDADTLLLCSDKSIYKEFFVRKGIKTSRYQVFDTARDELDAQLRFPLNVSPIYEDSRYSTLHSESEVKSQVAALLTKASQPVLVEEAIDGTLIRVPVMGNESPKAMPMVRQEGDAWVHAPLHESIKDRVGQIAIRAYSALRMHGYGIIDVIVDNVGNIFVAGAEPNASILPNSALAFSASKANLSYNQLLQLIVDLAIGRAEMVEVPIKGWQ